MRKSVQTALATSGAVLVAAMLLACGGNPSPGPTHTTAPTRPTASPSGAPTHSSNPKPSSPPAAVSAEQTNATRAAMEYLSGQNFSRKGLIDQLKFEGYPTKAATAAVDSLHMDWNEQAALVARDYLQSQAFSKKSLTSQLEFDGFSSSQAQYGVAHSGL